MRSTPPAALRRAERRAEYEALYQRHHREVWALAYARWLNADVALDITQETFLRFWKEWEQGTTINNPRAWLMRVARNLAEDHGKSAFRRNGTMPPQALNGLVGRQPMPLESLERAETFRVVREVLGAMAAADREILTFRYALEYDTDRIAEALRINSAAVHMRLSRARQRLAELLQARGVTAAT